MKTETRAARVKRLARELGAPPLDVSRLRPGPRAAVERLREMNFTDDQIGRAFGARLLHLVGQGVPWPTLVTQLLHEPPRAFGGSGSAGAVALDDPRRTFRPEIADVIEAARAEGLRDEAIRQMFRVALHEAVAAGHEARTIFARWFLGAEPTPAHDTHDEGGR